MLQAAGPIGPHKSATETESKESKRGRGGLRPGAGRKPDITKRLAMQVKPKTAKEILDQFDAAAMFQDIFKYGSRQLKLKAWTDLNDRAYGKPKQDVGISGGIVHAHTRDPFLALLPKEALDEYARFHDEMFAKYITNASQDGPHNQTEIKHAIEAEVVESDRTSA